MANRRFTSQFQYSYERQQVKLMSSFTQSGSTGVKASKVTQGITLTAVTQGAAGNSITIAFTGGATAGSEVVSVSGNAISVQIESGVSSVTQVRTAINLSAAAAALVVATGTNAATVATAAALPLLSGASTVFTNNTAQSTMTLTQIDTGKFQIALADPFPNLLEANISIQRSTAVDLKPQIASVATAFGTAQTITFFINAVATPTNLASGDTLYIGLTLRNSSN